MEKRTSLRSFVPYLFQYKYRIGIVIVSILLGKAATVGVPFVLKYVVDALEQGVSGKIALVLPASLILLYFVVRIANNVLNDCKDYIFAPAEAGIVRRVGRDLFSHLHELSLSFHLQKKTGSVVAKLERGMRAIEFIFRFLLFVLFPLFIEILLVIGVLFFFYPWVFGVTVLVTLIVYMAFTFWITESRNAVNRALNKSQNDAYGKAVDSILNFETVKYFVSEGRELERYDRSLQEVEKTQTVSKRFLFYTNTGQGIILSLGVGLLIYFAAQGVVDRTMTIGDFTLMLAFITQLSSPLMFLGTIYRQIKEGLVNMEDMFALFNEKSEVVEKLEAKELPDFQEALRFEDVSFSYPNQREVLSHVSFTIPKGKMVALVGPSGSGKTSITRLLFRFFDSTKGDITMDGISTRDLTFASLRGLIGFVPQDTILFNDTIYYNIAYGKPGATREEVEEAARKAHIHDFIMTLPEGYDSMVGERGLKLSGGEKQRVAIARVIIKGSPILVFDEATSSLDSKSEKAIQDAIRELSKERTLLIIAHRLSTIVEADNIIVLEKGVLKEEGTHRELLTKDGVYASLWKLQQEKREDGEVLV